MTRTVQAPPDQVFAEDFTAGPLLWARNKLNDLLLHRRNVESLRRLADIAERQR